MSYRNCPKHAEFYSKNKEKLVYLVGFIMRSNILLRGMRIFKLIEDFEIK